MTTTSTGRQAEQAAADYLVKKGYKILDQNWRTRWCEIDIVAQKKNAVYFVEVKYRKSTAWGSGLDYITPAKLKQMRFAAEFWVSSNDWGRDFRLAVVDVTGSNFTVSQFIDSL